MATGIVNSMSLAYPYLSVSFEGWIQVHMTARSLPSPRQPLASKLRRYACALMPSVADCS